MDVREKLVELICRFCSGLSVSDITPPYGYENLADFMISNGVTVQENVEISDELLKQLKNAPITICKEEPSIELVQEWISVDDRLPEDGDIVLCYMEFGEQRIARWDESENCWAGQLIDYHKEQVTHWMPLPQPPKGE